MSRTRWLTALLGAGAMVVLAAASARPLPGQATGTIRGTVRNADDNAPIGGARDYRRGRIARIRPRAGGRQPGRGNRLAVSLTGRASSRPGSA